MEARRFAQFTLRGSVALAIVFPLLATVDRDQSCSSQIITIICYCLPTSEITQYHLLTSFYVYFRAIRLDPGQWFRKYSP